MGDPGEEKDDWDFYPCRVDDAPASIFVNQRFARSGPVRDADTLYWLLIEILDKGDHGMGTAAEAEILHPVQDRVVELASLRGFTSVGRLRSDGWWQLSLYGPSGQLATLETLARHDGRHGDQELVLFPRGEVHACTAMPRVTMFWADLPDR